MKKKVYTIYYRRKREGKTDYKNRLALLKSGTPRLVIRKSNKNFTAQVIEYSPKGDNVLVTVCSQQLKKYGWDLNRNNTPAAYLVGLLVAKKSPKKEVILDIGLQTPTKNSKLFAFLKGAVDGGLSIPHSDEVLTAEDRVKGKHITEYFGKAADFSKAFQSYHSKGVDPKKFSDMLEHAKQNIIKEK